jgi:murein lipoprotein
MKKMLLTPMVIMLTVVGCASTGDVTDIQAQVDGLKTSVAQVSVDTANAKVAAENALSSAALASNAADKAEVYIKQVNDKIDDYIKERVK